MGAEHERELVAGPEAVEPAHQVVDLALGVRILGAVKERAALAVAGGEGRACLGSRSLAVHRRRRVCAG